MSPPPIVKSKRQQIGELIAFQRGEISMSKHNLADKTRSTTNNVERWERGDLVPTTQEWQRMRAVFPQLGAGGAAGSKYRELFDAAAAEQLASENARNTAKDPPPTGSRDLDAAVRMIMEMMPGLRSLTIEVSDDGDASVSYRTREVRIIEDSGNLQVRR